jgi:hypothetical protein
LKVDPVQPIGCVRMLNRLIDDAAARYTVTALVLSLFGVAAIVISISGVYKRSEASVCRGPSHATSRRSSSASSRAIPRSSWQVPTQRRDRRRDVGGDRLDAARPDRDVDALRTN